MGLGFPCNVSEGCLGENTACTAGACACEFGFIAINGTDSCSGKCLLANAVIAISL
ncbi:hypothetical protein DPMN_174198 [Dreissena polymorpha]|uniref:EB domain-containing protein n=1 Tax=Dreissena polymorpha TaxID=45954 RepID=A0A9D4IEY0_DREPO|nr:hypothetical protein DPMN_174198 [Dreissena polymorpha]